MVIQHNLAGLNARRNQRINESKLRKNLEKLSSGYRINRAGDDAAGLAISEQLRFFVKGADQALHNIGDSINLIQIAEGAMQEVHTMLNRMYECSIASSNAIYDDETGRQALQSEVAELKEEIGRISEATNFFGVPMLNGEEKVDCQFQIGPSADEFIEIDFANMIIGEDSLDIEDVNVETQEEAQKSLDYIEAAIGYVSEERGRMGAYQNRLEHAERSLEVRRENLVAAESRIRDTDMAAEITSYTKDNIMQEASMSMLAQANAVPQSVLNLLQ